MMTKKKMISLYEFLKLLSLAFFSAHPTMAKLRLPTFIASHMVLQREPQMARVWGWAAASAKVTLTVYDRDKNTLEVVSTIADKQSGEWTINIPPQPPQTGIALQFLEQVDVHETNIRILNDIAFGDVFLCSGQSNMQMSVSGAFNASEEIEDSSRYPDLRMATVNLTIEDSIQTDVKPMNTDYVWARSRSKAFDQERKPFSWFSASCYFFGREMYEYYDGSVPIGLLATSYGGTKVECWSSPTAMKDETCGGTTTSTPTTADMAISTASESATTSSSATRALENTEKRPSVSPLRALSSRSSAKADDSKPVLPGHQNQRQRFQDHGKEDWFLQFDETPPNDNYNNIVGDNNGPHCNLEDGTKDSQLWNAMIYPFLNMRFVGAVWYQGEANAADPANYACRFPAMISDWRRQFLNNKNKDSNLFLETKTERGGVPVEPASNDGDDHYIPFVYVQLAAFENSDSDYSKIRAAQDAALAMPNVGVAHAIDLGDPDSPNGAIHPRRKQEVGRRLSLTMRALLDSYRNRKEKNDDENKYYWSGPVLLGPVQIVNHTVAILTFDARTTEGMHLHGTGGCTGCCDEGASPFETMDSDGNWTMASVVAIEGDMVTIQAAPRAVNILGVHLHWQGFPQCALYNGEGGPDDHAGLPAPPVEWCAHPIPGEGPWTGKACGTQVPTLLKLAS